jgi:osmotically-inducible protein OsmY
MSEKRPGGRLLPLQERDTGLAKEKEVVEAGAQSRLRASGYCQLHLVSCEFHEGVLTLRGQVSTFFLKQVAQTLIRDLDGVGEINNRLEVAASC